MVGPENSSVADETSRSEEDAVYAKITRRILPYLFAGYLLAFLDRINIGYAQLQMKDALGFSDAVYGFGAGIFFLAYLLFEVPSNLLLERVGVRLTLLRIMTLWGVTSAATMLVQTPAQLYVVRFLLGVFEAGFFPGIILYLTYWFPRHRRGRVTGQFMFAIPVAGMIGGPLSGWILTNMDGAHGLAGWQWMFLIEGLPTVLLGVVCYHMLPNRPKDAQWLTEAEKAVVARAMARDSEGAQSHSFSGRALRGAFLDPRIWILAFIYFTTAVANYTFTFWLPTMVKALGVNSNVVIGWITFLPYVFAALGILVICGSSDRRRERRWHIGVTFAIGAVALALTTLPGIGLGLSVALLCIVGFFQFGAGILYWALPPSYLSRDTAAVGIAVISSIGVIGGFVSPTLLGLIRTATGSLSYGIYCISGLMIVGALTVVFAVPRRAVAVTQDQPAP